jgi:hypothetical protein
MVLPSVWRGAGRPWWRPGVTRLGELVFFLLVSPQFEAGSKPKAWMIEVAVQTLDAPPTNVVLVRVPAPICEVGTTL